MTILPTLCKPRPCLPSYSARSAATPLISVILGTRPEAVKLAPVIRALSPQMRTRIVLTGQHKEMVDDLLADLGLCPDVNFGVMRPRQSLNTLTARLMANLADEIAEHRPDAVVVQGDTTTALCAALASFHESVPVAHVEAGLRSRRRDNPFPEEANRRLVGQLATWHFAPTARARHNLLAEGRHENAVDLTGNTVIDSLLWVQQCGLGKSAFAPSVRRKLLVTLHRRETQGPDMVALCRAIAGISRELDLDVVLPMHRSPAVRDCILPELSSEKNVCLTEPLGYLDFVATLADATLVVTDSGGIQEEAPSLGVPLLVARDTTERPEAIEAGCGRLIGTDPDNLIFNVRNILGDPLLYSAMAQATNPFGDGHAAERIADRLAGDLAQLAAQRTATVHAAGLVHR